MLKYLSYVSLGIEPFVYSSFSCENPIMTEREVAKLLVRISEDTTFVCSGNWGDIDNSSGVDHEEYLHVLRTVNKSYQAFLAFFDKNYPLDDSDVLVASNFIYAWETGKFVYGDPDLEKVVEILNKEKEKSELKKEKECTS